MDGLRKTWQRAEVRLVRERAEEPYGPTMADPSAIAAFLRPIIGSLAQEAFVVLALNMRHRLIAMTTAGLGGIAACPVEPAAVLRFALLAGAASVAVAHNHPSSCCDPSADDVVLTRHLSAACTCVGVPLLDHVIVTADASFSFAAHGLLPLA